MKKFILMFVLLLASVNCFGITIRETLSYNMDYLTEAESKKQVNFMLFDSGEYLYQVFTNHDNVNDRFSDVSFFITSRDVTKFETSLNEIKTKYQIWAKVAKINNTKDFCKDMNIEIKDITGILNNSLREINYDMTFNTCFQVDNNGNCIVTLISSPIKHFPGRMVMTFSSADEIEKFINVFSDNTLGKILAKKQHRLLREYNIEIAE